MTAPIDTETDRAPRLPRGSRLGLGQRLAVAFGVAAVVSLAALGVAGWSFSRQNQARHRLVGQVDPALVQAQVLLGAYVNEETGVRGFVLSGQQAFLQPYTQGLADQRTARHQLDNLLSHEPASARLLAVAERRAAQWRQQFALPAIAAVRAGRGRAFSSSAVLNAALRRFDAVRSAFATLDRSLVRARAASGRSLDRAATAFIATGIVGVVLLLFAGLAAWLAVRFWVVHPLAALGDDVRRVATGDLHHRIAPSGPPELALLGTDADAMRRRIVQELGAIEDARLQLLAANTDLEQTNTDLARSNVELEQFAYVASHDLQEPLRKVASFCQLLQRRYEGQLDERANEYIAFAVDGANRMQTLINDLLAFSRVGRTTDAFVRVDLQTVFDQVLRNLDSAIVDTRATVDSDPLPAVEGDASLLAALLQNLIGNSVKFRATEHPVVSVGCQERDGMWLFDVTDNGIGIEQRFAERVFVIFQRLHTKDAYPGTGIGLALCKKIVEFHRGRIWVDPDYDHGTRICWTLPITGAT